ncbi:hypothetical protein [Pseudomonas sediminis]|uniref:hypothetical protein n=1 Tax=Pseudomonas sediminis TaxID=1691904 RepID=UPI0031CC80FD
MTRNERRAIWAVALSLYGAQSLEQKVLGFLEALLLGDWSQELPAQVSAEGLAQLIGFILRDIESGERPLLSQLRNMNRQHFRALYQFNEYLTFSILADLPAAVVPRQLLALKLELSLGL